MTYTYLQRDSTATWTSSSGYWPRSPEDVIEVLASAAVDVGELKE